MGIVYVAYDERLDRRVAVKRMLAATDDPRRRARLRREARTTAQLAHPAVVQVFDLIEDEDSDWIVMELVEGQSLARVLEGGPLGCDSTLQYGRQIAEGLAAAHRLGIVHRDLKTENVMVLPDSRVKILDFGLAKRLDFLSAPGAERTLSQPGAVMGTGRAMSPEQARGLKVGPRSDLFSFGILLYEMLTGVSPFRAESLGGTLERVLTHQPQPVDEMVDHVPRELAQLVDRLLCKAPELRPASAHVVAEELAHLDEVRRFQLREASTSDALDSAATATATEFLLASDSTVDRTRLDRSARFGRFGIREIFAVLAVVVAVALTIVFLTPRIERPDHDAAGNEQVAEAEALPEDPLELYEEGMRSVRRIEQPKNIERATVIFQRLLELDGDSAAAHAGLARAYWEKSRNASAGGDPVFLEQASAMAREAVRLDAYLADARVSLGLIHHSQGQHDEARGQFEHALELDPTNADSHYGLAKVSETLGQMEDAESHYRQAIERQPEPLYYDALGSLVYKSGRYDEAEAAFLESLALAPDDVHALRNLGVIYYAQGRMDEAAAKFQAALKIRPNASLYSNLGTIFFTRGLYAKAAAAFEDALSMDGASNRTVFWLNLADAYRQVPGREEDSRTAYRRAILMLDESLESAPNNLRSLSRRALASARVGDRATAVDDLVRLRELGTGSDLYSLFRMAVAEELCGERDQALAHLEEALRSGFALSEVRQEPDLQELRADLRFHHLLLELEEGR